MARYTKKAHAAAVNWGEPKEDRGLLITLYSLVVLMDLGLDPGGKQARKMTAVSTSGWFLSRSITGLSFMAKRSPASTAESLRLARISKNRMTSSPLNSWASRSKMAVGTAKRFYLQQTSEKPALFVPYHHLRA